MRPRRPSHSVVPCRRSRRGHAPRAASNQRSRGSRRSGARAGPSSDGESDPPGVSDPPAGRETAESEGADRRTVWTPCGCNCGETAPPGRQFVNDTHAARERKRRSRDKKRYGEVLSAVRRKLDEDARLAGMLDFANSGERHSLSFKYPGLSEWEARQRDAGPPRCVDEGAMSVPSFDGRGFDSRGWNLDALYRSLAAAKNGRAGHRDRVARARAMAEAIGRGGYRRIPKAPRVRTTRWPAADNPPLSDKPGPVPITEERRARWAELKRRSDRQQADARLPEVDA
jgi:hypothetical protein